MTWYEHWGAVSPLGPALCALGVAAMSVGLVLHRFHGWPTILAAKPEADDHPPRWTERLSLHLIVYAAWAIGFGAIDWRGPPVGMIDTRLSFERTWPVVESAEWIYFSAYLVPLAMPWLPVTRGALRRYALHLWALLAVCVVCFLVLPLGAPPRLFTPESAAGRLLAWETSRQDFAAASLPSFHALWGMLCASLLATTGRVGAWLGWSWAILLAAACIANGAHAVLDVAASVVLYLVLTRVYAPARRRPVRRPTTTPTMTPSASAPAPK